VKFNPEITANDILELSSKQRLAILSLLNEKSMTVSAIAKELNATVPEVFRNFERLTKAELIEKNTEGQFILTTYGKLVCIQIRSLEFMAENKKYFKKHDFGDLPDKFIQRISALNSGKHIVGFVKVMEQWNDVYKNATKYIFNILSEVSYNSDLIKTLVEKLEKNIIVHSIFSESTIIPQERKKTLEKINFKKFIQNGNLERKMRKNIKISVLLNEKEACIMFPNINEETDLREMFYSDDPVFHEWCLDYFEFCWQNAGIFQEGKLREQ
jgi:predicted transcriptional regulator